MYFGYGYLCHGTDDYDGTGDFNIDKTYLTAGDSATARMKIMQEMTRLSESYGRNEISDTVFNFKRRILAEDVAKLKTKFNWSNDLYTETLSFLNKKISDAIYKHDALLKKQSRRDTLFSRNNDATINRDEALLRKQARRDVLYSRNNARIASGRRNGTILRRPANGGAVR